MRQEMTTTLRDVAPTGGRTIARSGNGAETTRPRPVYRPRADIYQKGESFFVLVDMPGVAPDDVDVTLERRVLTIRGHVAEISHQGYRQIYAEYRDGDFERGFTLSEDIDPSKIKAVHRNGVLALELPRATEAKTKKIKVKS